MLNDLNKKQVEKITGIEIDEYHFIYSINPDSVIVGEYDLEPIF